MPNADAISICYISPIFIAYVGYLFLNEKLDRLYIPSFICNFIGLLFVVKPAFLRVYFNIPLSDNHYN